MLQYGKDSCACPVSLVPFLYLVFGVIQIHLEWIGIQISACQSVLYGFCVFKHFIRAWCDAHIIVSCKYTYWGLWNTRVQGEENFRLMSFTLHGWFYYSHATCQLLLFAWRENGSTIHSCVNLDVGCTIPPCFLIAFVYKVHMHVCVFALEASNNYLCKIKLY